MDVSQDIEIRSLDRDGGRDYLDLRVCFTAPQHTVERFIQERGLETAESPMDVDSCVAGEVSFYTRVAGPGWGGRGDMVSVNGFSSSEQRLAYEPQTGTVYYVFIGMD